MNMVTTCMMTILFARRCSVRSFRASLAVCFLSLGVVLGADLVANLATPDYRVDFAVWVLVFCLLAAVSLFVWNVVEKVRG